MQFDFPHSNIEGGQLSYNLLLAGVDVGQGMDSALSWNPGTQQVEIPDSLSTGNEATIQAVIAAYEYNIDWEFLALSLADAQVDAFTFTDDSALLLAIGMATTTVRVLEILKGASLK